MSDETWLRGAVLKRIDDPSEVVFLAADRDGATIRVTDGRRRSDPWPTRAAEWVRATDDEAKAARESTS